MQSGVNPYLNGIFGEACKSSGSKPAPEVPDEMQSVCTSSNMRSDRLHLPSGGVEYATGSKRVGSVTDV